MDWKQIEKELEALYKWTQEQKPSEVEMNQMASGYKEGK